jgi:hypothetical protein
LKTIIDGLKPWLALVGRSAEGPNHHRLPRGSWLMVPSNRRIFVERGYARIWPDAPNDNAGGSD